MTEQDSQSSNVPALCRVLPGAVLVMVAVFPPYVSVCVSIKCVSAWRPARSYIRWVCCFQVLAVLMVVRLWVLGGAGGDGSGVP